MPVDEIPYVDFARLRRCREQVAADMRRSGFQAGQFKYQRVLERRARKLYLRGGPA